MPIQFPPVAQGDPQPQDGDTFLYTVTQEEFVCRKQDEFTTPQWYCRGTFRDSTFAYQGTLEIQQPAPTDAKTGFIYSVSDGGIADVSFGSLGGEQVDQWNLVIYTGTDWVLVTANSTASPWIRTVGGQIQPIVQTDDLDMVQGTIDGGGAS